MKTRTILIGAEMLLIILSMSVRIVYLTRNQSLLRSPGTEMERGAVNLAREGTLARVYSDETGKSAHLSPLYPLLLGGLYRLFGWDTVAGGWGRALCSIVTTTAGIALLPLVSRRALLSASAGWGAAFALAVLPINLHTETSGAWEQPYAALVLLGILVMFSRLRDDKWRDRRRILLVGGLLGLAALLSPALLPAGALMIAGEFVSQRGGRSRVAIASLVIGLTAGLVITPWVVRNYYALGGFVPLRSTFGSALAAGNNPQADGIAWGSEAVSVGNPTERARLQSMGERAYMREKQRVALGWMAAHPAEVLRLTMLRFRLYWFPSRNLWEPTSPFRGLKAAIIGLLGAAALLNLAYLALTRHDRAWLLAAAAIGPSLVYMVTVVGLRYRYPTFGLCALLAFDLLGSVWRSIAGRTRRTGALRRK